MKTMHQVFLEKGWQDNSTLELIRETVKEYLSQYYIGGEGFTEELNCCEVYLNEKLLEIKNNI